MAVMLYKVINGNMQSELVIARHAISSTRNGWFGSKAKALADVEEIDPLSASDLVRIEAKELGIEGYADMNLNSLKKEIRLAKEV